MKVSDRPDDDGRLSDGRSAAELRVRAWVGHADWPACVSSSVVNRSIVDCGPCLDRQWTLLLAGAGL